jgi:hypothetical protein
MLLNQAHGRAVRESFGRLSPLRLLVESGRVGLRVRRRTVMTMTGWFGAALLLGGAVGCASTTADGGSQGSPLGGAGGTSGHDSGLGGPSSSGGTGSSGAPNSGGGGAEGIGTGGKGGTDAGSGAAICPTYPGLPGGQQEPWVTDPSQFDGSTFGCHASRDQAPVGWLGAQRVDQCPGTSWRCDYEPRELPCGTCTNEGFACSMGVLAACDCGRGPFLQSYGDQWVCKCDLGKWDCRITAPSGSSCFFVCPSSRDAGPG